MVRNLAALKKNWAGAHSMTSASTPGYKPEISPGFPKRTTTFSATQHPGASTGFGYMGQKSSNSSDSNKAEVPLSLESPEVDGTGLVKCCMKAETQVPSLLDLPCVASIQGHLMSVGLLTSRKKVKERGTRCPLMVASWKLQPFSPCTS